MSVSQQYALDVHRAAQHGTPPPPAPGTHDWRTVRELREAHLESRRVRVRAPRPPRRRPLRRAAGVLRALRALRLLRAPRQNGGRGPAEGGPLPHCGGSQAQCS
ncbi:hypothetical protein DVA86_26880 [Streptomyces armeniacus]|uniref:Uncharacterized protein n=1 Tax=Streptomyces armeniacus TaxID=83291 RepID=A0A345XVQ4_9ACTN|nr:hypothetical protein [Streptomyces armeniacus]AXK35720.1 hypothetical protein DVA86_26880 [Streptomyces armeniacus]